MTTEEPTISYVEGVIEGAQFAKESPGMSLRSVKGQYTRYFEMPHIAKADRLGRLKLTDDHKAGFIRGYFA